MTTIKQVLDADYWYMRGKKDAQKEFLDFLIKLKEEELPMFESKDVGDGYMEDFNLDYPLLDKKIEELKKAVKK